MSTIAENLTKVQERIARACDRAGRSPEEVRLVAVSKTVEVTRIRAAIQAGVREIGENYIQEAEPKLRELGDQPLVRHFIGHLQRNKAGKAVELFDIVQSVDSLRLAQTLSRRAESAGKTLDALLEVNISAETSKFGLSPAETLAVAEQIGELPGIQLRGLMGIGPLDADPEAARTGFQALARLFRQLPNSQRQVLSMGMSADLEVAISEGSTMVRVGTSIFGSRR